MSRTAESLPSELVIHSERRSDARPGIDVGDCPTRAEIADAVARSGLSIVYMTLI